ncbi:MAG: amino-acid N-acetyltransferase, partial [Treponema sp.]|nr:amino-acid N-acetyltransferase [Treponema sp.]
ITTEAAIPFVEMAAFHVATRVMTGLAADNSGDSGGRLNSGRLDGYRADDCRTDGGRMGRGRLDGYRADDCRTDSGRMGRGRVDAVIGNFVRARAIGVENGVDMGQSGRVDRILTESIERVLNLGMTPILPCIGWSATGKPYNVSSNEIALTASIALKANKLFIVTLEPALWAQTCQLPETIQVDERGRIVRLTPQEAEAILELNSRPGAEDKPLDELRLALRASRAGVDRVHLIDAREEGAVLRELFSNLGAGTMVYADEYESIRPLQSRDIPDLLRLMEPLMRQGILVRRSPEDIQEQEGDYAVFEIDGSVHACGALHDWGEGQGEIAAITTDSAYADMGLGRRIVRYLIDRAKKQGLRRVFILTTRAQDWFELLGFKECPVESLPERKRRSYDKARGSKAYALDLGT